MLIVFWDMQRIILQKFQPHGECCVVLHHFAGTPTGYSLQATRTPEKGVILLDENACPHTARVMQELLQTFHWDNLEHPPYSPNLAHSDFYLFGSLKIIWVSVILQMMMP